MTDRETHIPLSVVISTTKEPCSVIRDFDGLRRQLSAINGQLIVISRVAPASAIPPDASVHHVAGGSIFDCRAAALSLASGDIVALTEDHCVHPPDWCERILHNFSKRPDLVLLGGAVANGSTRSIEDLMSYWMTFSAFAPGQVIARHPCTAQFIVKAAAIDRRLKTGELENALVQKLQAIPDAVYIDPELIVRHDQSHGFWNTFVIHFHNGRAAGGFAPQRIDNRNAPFLQCLAWGWQDVAAHFRRSKAAFQAGQMPLLVRTGYFTLILPLLVAHGIGAVVGYRKGPGVSPHHLV